MDHLWIYLSICSAFFLSASDALAKKVVTQYNEYVIAWLRLFFCLPLLFLSLFFINVPVLDRPFFIAFFVALPFEILAMILYIKALRMSPLSLTLPFLSLTPLFLILFSYLILHEPVSFQGGAGIVCIAAGGYILNVDTSNKGVLQPFRAILKERGSVYMIIVAFLYSFTSSLGKVAVVHSSPLFFGTTYFIAVTLFFAPFPLKSNGYTGLKVFDKKMWTIIAFSGIAYSLMIISHMFAINIANVAYMISLKRTSLLIGVVFGYLFFHEKKIGQRFIGAFFMFVGFVLIVTSQ